MLPTKGHPLAPNGSCPSTCKMDSPYPTISKCLSLLQDQLSPKSTPKMDLLECQISPSKANIGEPLGIICPGAPCEQQNSRNYLALK